MEQEAESGDIHTVHRSHPETTLSACFPSCGDQSVRQPPNHTHTHTRTHTRQSPRAAQTASSIIYRHHNTDAVLTGKAPSVTRAQPSIGNEGQPGPAEGAGDGRSAPLRPGAAYWDLRVMYDAVARGRVDDIKLPGYIC